MKKLGLIFSLLLAQNFAYTEELMCKLNHNGNETFKQRIQVTNEERVHFIDVENYQIMIRKTRNSFFEIEAYEISGPSRNYASSYLRNNDDELSWSFWSREILLEVICKLYQ